MRGTCERGALGLDWLGNRLDWMDGEAGASFLFLFFFFFFFLVRVYDVLMSGHRGVLDMNMDMNMNTDSGKIWTDGQMMKLCVFARKGGYDSR
jgi:hypothetical protein